MIVINTKFLGMGNGVLVRLGAKGDLVGVVGGAGLYDDEDGGNRPDIEADRYN